jgi:hypothetical protein
MDPDEHAYQVSAEDRSGPGLFRYGGSWSASGDTEMMENLVQLSILDYAHEIGVIAVGKIVVASFFGFAKPGILVPEIIYRKRTSAIPSKKSQGAIRHRIARSLRVPIEEHRPDMCVFRERLRKRIGRGVGVRKIPISYQAMHGPRFEKLVGNVQQAAIFGIDQLPA